MGLFSVFKRKHEKATSKSTGLDKIRMAEQLKSVEKNAIEFKRKSSEESTAIGASKVGGKPHLPAGFQWPYFEGVNYENVKACRPLSFIAQIDLAEAAPFDIDNKLPQTGFLYFFYELNTMKGGFDAEDKGCARVFYFDVARENLSITEYPNDLSPDYYVPQSAIEFCSARSIPSFEEFGDNNRADWDVYEQVAKENGLDMERSPESIFKLLGYADLIQGSILLECAMAESALTFDDWKTLSESQKTKIYAKGDEWVLLSQFGTIADSIMFGDCGCIYFYIRKEDLDRHRFDDVHLSLQCY